MVEQALAMNKMSRNLRTRRSLVKLLGVLNDVTKMVTECLRITKLLYIALFGQKRL